MAALTDAEAWAEICDDCGAVKGAPCVYLAPKDGKGHPINPDFTHWYSPKVQAQLARVGTATKRPHNARFRRASDRRWRRGQRAVQAARRGAVVPASPALLAAARAMREFDLAEHERLRQWLRVHGALLARLAG